MFGTLYVFAYHISIIFNNGIKPCRTHVAKAVYPSLILIFF